MLGRGVGRSGDADAVVGAAEEGRDRSRCDDAGRLATARGPAAAETASDPAKTGDFGSTMIVPAIESPPLLTGVTPDSTSIFPTLLGSI